MGKYRRSFGVLAFVVGFILVFSIGMAYAKDAKVGPVEVTSVIDAVDKNGNQYTRIIVTEDRTLDGVAYKAGVPAMAFGDVMAQMDGVKAGDKITFIAGERMFNGNKSYTIIKVLP